ncbi:MAG: DUF695 domain-containing protein [Adhaeribacter sp.]
MQDKEISSLKEQYQEEWDFYFSNVDDIFSSIAVDLGLIKIAPVKTQPNVLWIIIKMNDPRTDGLSSSGEFEVLSAIEDILVENIKADFEATHVGRLTSNGYRDIYFYVGETTHVEKTISEAMLQFPDYEYEYGTKLDEEWNGYFNFLYPSPWQLQSIQNRRVIDNLEENGDSLIKERPVDHWIYFKSQTDREAYLAKVTEEGFMVISQEFIAEMVDFPYSLHISRIDKVDQSSIDDCVYFLWKSAQEHNGDYDGWETSIETN